MSLMSSSQVTRTTIADAEEAVKVYLEEAEYCADHEYYPGRVLGFAAMTVALSCVVTMGEALIGRSRPTVCECIEAFCREMTVQDWLVTAPDSNSDDPAQILKRVRNALIHALSLPDDVGLLRDPEDFSVYRSRIKVGIVPRLFVQAVRDTMQSIVTKYPNLEFDTSSTAKGRSLAEVDTYSSSGSMPSR